MLKDTCMNCVAGKIASEPGTAACNGCIPRRYLDTTLSIRPCVPQNTKIAKQVGMYPRHEWRTHKVKRPRLSLLAAHYVRRASSVVPRLTTWLVPQQRNAEIALLVQMTTHRAIDAIRQLRLGVGCRALGSLVRHGNRLYCSTQVDSRA